MKFSLQVAAEDCTGCALCVDVCPARNKTGTRLKAINMRPQAPLRAMEHDNWNFFPDAAGIRPAQDQDRDASAAAAFYSRCSSSAARAPGAARRRISRCSRSCSATARSSPTPRAAPRSMAATCRPRLTPRTNAVAGPTWCNSLFEDNAEFGLGFRVSIDKQKEFAGELLKRLASQLGDHFVTEFCWPTKAMNPAFTISVNGSLP